MFVILGVYDPFKRSLNSKQSILIDFVAISEHSQAPMQVPSRNSQTPPQQKPAQKPKKPTPPKSSKPNTPPPSARQSRTTSPTVPKAPAPPPPAPMPAEKPQKKPTPPPKKAQPEEAVAPPKKAWLDLKEEEKLLEELGREAPAESSEPQGLEDLLEELADSVEDAALPGAQAADRLGDIVTATEIDAIRRHVARCWIVPNGVRGAKDLAVEIAMRLRPDATVYEAKIVNAHRMQHDPLFRAAAESARRAVLDPQCNPFPLSPEKYNQWKNIELTFNPKEMY